MLKTLAGGKVVDKGEQHRFTTYYISPVIKIKPLKENYKLVNLGFLKITKTRWNGSKSINLSQSVVLLT